MGSWRLIIVAALVLLGLLLLAGLREADAADLCARDPLFQTFCDDEPSPNASVGLAAGPGSLMITRERQHAFGLYSLLLMNSYINLFSPHTMYFLRSNLWVVLIYRHTKTFGKERSKITKYCRPVVQTSDKQNSQTPLKKMNNRTVCTYSFYYVP